MSAGQATSSTAETQIDADMEIVLTGINLGRSASDFHLSGDCDLSPGQGSSPGLFSKSFQLLIVDFQ